MRAAKRERDGWSRMILLFKLELILLYVFLAPCRVYRGSDSIPLVPLPFPALGPRHVRTVYSVLSNHTAGLNMDRREAWTGENIEIDVRKCNITLGRVMVLNAIKILFFFFLVQHKPKQFKLERTGSKLGFDRTSCMMPENSLAWES